MTTTKLKKDNVVIIVQLPFDHEHHADWSYRHSKIIKELEELGYAKNAR